MVLLSDGTLKKLIEEGELGIDPEPDEIQYQPGSIDFRLGDNYSNEHTGEIYNNVDKMVIEPGKFYLSHTQEVIEVPDDLSVMISGRSSFGRKGLIIHATAGWVDAGFKGDVTLEIFNLSNTPIVIAPGQRVGQMMFFKMDAPAEEPYGEKKDSKYQEQRGPTESRIEKDPEIK